MSPLRFVPSGLFALSGVILWLLVPESSSWIEGLILFSSAMFLIFIAFITFAATMENSPMPTAYLSDPFASPMHRKAVRDHRRNRFPNGLASPSWYRDAFSPRAASRPEHSIICE